MKPIKSFGGNEIMSYYMEIIDESDNTAYSTDSPIKAWAYMVAREFGERNQVEAEECAELAQYIWLEDDNTIPIGHLVDVVAKKLEHLKTIYSKWELIEFVINCDLDYEREE